MSIGWSRPWNRVYVQGSCVEQMKLAKPFGTNVNTEMVSYNARYDSWGTARAQRKLRITIGRED